MVKYLVMVVALACAVPVLADTYKWVDDTGTVNFTSDFGSVPKKFRKKVVIISDEQSGGAEVVDQTEAAEEPESRMKQKKAASVEDVSGAAGKKEPAKKKIYGPRDEEGWKSEFEKNKAELKRIADLLSQRRSRLADSSKLTRAEYLGLQVEIKGLESAYNSQATKLNALNDEASRYGVPFDLRR